MTYYDTLQVTQDASAEVIHMAYKALAKKYHPDLYDGNKEFAKQKMQLINEAYGVLSSPTLRIEYDLKLRQQSHNVYTQYNYNTTTQSQSSYTPPPVHSNKGMIGLIKTMFAGVLKAILFCRSHIIVTLGVILLLFLLLGNMGTFDNADNDSLDDTTSSHYAETETLPMVVEPESGAILSGYEDSNGSELTITASGGHSCVVKLKTNGGYTRLSFYVRAGDTVTVGVPSELLYVYFASGTDWYGDEHLFGEDTNYSMDSKICDFTQYTWEYTLQPVVNGNFSQTVIDEEEFK